MSLDARREEVVMHASQWVKRRGFIMRLELPSTRVCRSEAFVGVARLRSTSAKEVVVGRLSASLWAIGNENGSEVILDELLFERKPLSPLQEFEHPFWLRTPKEAALGSARVLLTTGGGLLPYVLPPFVTVMVAPERRLAALVELVAEISKHEITGWTVAGGGDGFHAQMKPRMEMEDRMQGIGMELYPSGQGVYGAIVVMAREHGLLGVFPTTQRAQRFRFPTTDLAEARREFDSILLPFVNDLRGLPLPSQSGLTTTSLPLPASGDTAA